MTPEIDLAFIRESLPDLRDYLFSKEIYWRLNSSSKGAKLSQLTIGNLLLCQTRLRLAQLPSQQKNDFLQISAGIEQIQAEWLANWRIKAGQEFRSRLNLWNQYMRELRGDIRQHSPFYVNEVRHRAIMALLQSGEHVNDLAKEEAQVLLVDQILRAITQPGLFIWEPEYASGFPESQFWFLYVTFR